ncbi:MAG: DUF3179 domain-containing protein [Rhodothermales bacterium]|nr:DUF3179 domain-containing protein [Rhodothermales bacterium]
MNDRFGSTPVAVTFCPLCHSALAFLREVDGQTLEFGVSGMLRHSDLVMYDRQTHSLWQQLNGEAIVGAFTETMLEQVPAQIISFGEFRAAWPKAEVLSTETGFSRPYGRNPYPGYDDIDDKPWLFDGKIDGRLRPMERVVGVRLGGSAVAYPHSETRERRAINDVISGEPIVVFHAASPTVSALDAEAISRSRRVGSTGVFSRRVDGRVLTFKEENGGFRDEQTGSVWDVTGAAVDGPFKGRRMEAIPHGDMFSFAWMVVHPDTKLYGR